LQTLFESLDLFPQILQLHNLCPPVRDEGELTIGFRVNDKISLMSRSSLAVDF
jgi:hypothetical protein